MTLLDAVLLGIVQGLTEFLPVSSSGHLVIGQALLGIEVPGVGFEVAVHLATLCAVVWVYRRRIGQLLVGVARGAGEAWGYVGLLALASVPAGLAGTLGARWLEPAFGEPRLAAAMLLATGGLAWSIRATSAAARRPRPGPAAAVWIGIAQAVAILPGLSRSGTTMAVGSWRGVESVRMAEFTFLLSVPAILGAGILKAGEIGSIAGGEAGLLAVAFVAALLSGVIAIRLFVRMLAGNSFHRFAWYCWAVGAAYLVATIAVPSLR